MWKIATLLIFALELTLTLAFIIGRLKKRKWNESTAFIAVVAVVNFALHIIPYLYNTFVLEKQINHVFGVIDCFNASLKLFVGTGSTGLVSDFAAAYPLFSIAYLFGVAIATLTTISATIEAFGNSIKNGFILSKRLKKESCDIVIGHSPDALKYAKGCSSVLLLGEKVDKSIASELMEVGYCVLRRSFSPALLKGHQFNESTRYNVICFGEEKALEYIDSFISYKKSDSRKNVHLYVEVEGSKAENIRREIVEKSGLGAYVNTFCTAELLARTFIEENPITKHLPAKYIENAHVKSGTEVSVFLLGYGKLSHNIYRGSVMSNQLATFDGEYKVLPIKYYLCDKGIDSSAWLIDGLKDALGELDSAEHFPLPELPYSTTIIGASPSSPQVISAIKAQVKDTSGYTAIIIDTEDDCENIELGAKLKSKLFGLEDYHIFVRSEAAYAEGDEVISYFGGKDTVINHDVIVNDSLSAMARRLNEVYAVHYASEAERARLDFADYIHKKAEEQWNALDCFTLSSNIYAAMNLRLKLNLLGLDYVKDGKGENTSLIGQRLCHRGSYSYDEYFTPSARNSLIAEEHARWNAYHLANEYLPLEKEGISVRSRGSHSVRFNVKNNAAKKHACLTTYAGLNELSEYLAKAAGEGYSAADYDYYIFDELLITSAEELARSLGYSIVEK